MSSELQLLQQALSTWPRWLPDPGSPPRVMRPLEGGLTNRSWLVDTENGQAVIRLNCPDGHILGINRDHEAMILAAVAANGLAPPVWYRDDDLLVCGWIEGTVWTSSDFTANTARLMALVEQYSAVALPLPPFDYSAHIDHYRHQLLEWGCPLPAGLEQQLRQLRPVIERWQQSFVPALTHHDLTPGNVIEDPDGRLWVLDWEYAALGCPALDLSGLGSGSGFPEALVSLMGAYWQLVRDRLPAL